MEWAGSKLSKQDAKDYDDVLATGNKTAITFAVKALMAQYENANGRDPKLVTGKQSAPERYRSMAEVTRDMAKPDFEITTFNRFFFFETDIQSSGRARAKGSK